MLTKRQLRDDFNQLGINPNGTLLIHSSMKAVGSVEGGADAVLDVWMEAMSGGLLVLPTHTWKTD
jgi:aminoglycoside 3-N-acetyltransferase